MATAITFANLKLEVAERLGNLEDDDLYFERLGEWVNRAANEVILRALEKGRYRYGLFPELHDEWIVDATANAVGFIEIPADCRIIMGVYSFDDADAGGAITISTSDKTIMTEISWRQYQLLPKTATGWPRLWNRYGNRIRIHPTPSDSPTDYTTKTLIVGIAEENTMSGANDTLVIDPIWHPAVIDYAVYLGATALRWDADADRALGACDRKLTQALSTSGYENRLGNYGRKIKGDPTRIMR